MGREGPRCLRQGQRAGRDAERRSDAVESRRRRGAALRPRSDQPQHRDGRQLDRGLVQQHGVRQQLGTDGESAGHRHAGRIAPELVARDGDAGATGRERGPRVGRGRGGPRRHDERRRSGGWLLGAARTWLGGQSVGAYLAAEAGRAWAESGRRHNVAVRRLVRRHARARAPDGALSVARLRRLLQQRQPDPRGVDRLLRAAVALSVLDAGARDPRQRHGRRSGSQRRARLRAALLSRASSISSRSQLDAFREQHDHARRLAARSRSIWGALGVFGAITHRGELRVGRRKGAQLLEAQAVLVPDADRRRMTS